MIILLAILTKTYNFVKLHWKVVLAAILGALFVLKAQGCYHKLVPSKPNSGPSSPTTKPLPKGDKEVITVNPTNGTTTVTTGKGTTTVNGTRGTTIEVKTDGTVKVTEKTIGFCHNIMIGAAVNNTGVKGTVGLEWFFYKRLDLISGIGADKYLSHTAVFTGIGYTPVNKIFHGNTSIWIGGSMDTTATKSIMAGFSVRI
jgi:hypothetical protein